MVEFYDFIKKKYLNAIGDLVPVFSVTNFCDASIVILLTNQVGIAVTA